MAFVIPPSAAMDVTAAGGGPVTMLPSIATGSPEQISSHIAQRLRQAEQFIQIIESLTSTTQQLSSAWSGSASEAAVQKITTTVSAFMRIVKVIQTGSALLGISGATVQSAQTAYTGVVSSVNPTVASLMSNPWTYSAATALSTAASGSLRSYIGICQGLLTGLGSGNMMQQVMALMMIIQEIEQLSASSSASSASSATSVVTVTPATPAQSSTASGQPAAAPVSGAAASSQPNGFTNYTPTALTGYTGARTAGGSVA
jgi:uncharacterized protein YukE